MEENNKQTIDEKKEKVSSLLKELKSAFTDLTKARIAYTKTKAKETTKETVAKCKDTITTSAKNFGIKMKTSLEANSKNYDNINAEIQDMENRYEQAIEFLAHNYLTNDKEINLKIAELSGKKDEIIAEFSLKNEEKNSYINENIPDLTELKNKKEDLQQKAADAIKNGNIEQAESMLGELKDLRTSLSEKEGTYKDELKGFNDELSSLKAEYRDISNQIETLKELRTSKENEFEEMCEKSFETKEKGISEVKRNKVFDRIKGFLSKSILTQGAKAKKFNEDYLKPFNENIKSFIDSVPEKAKALKESTKEKITSLQEKGKDTLDKTKETVIEAKDFTKGKIQDAIEAAYQFGADTKSKFRGKAIDFLENMAEKFNEKAENLRDKEEQAKNNKENKSKEEDAQEI